MKYVDNTCCVCGKEYTTSSGKMQDDEWGTFKRSFCEEHRHINGKCLICAKPIDLRVTDHHRATHESCLQSVSPRPTRETDERHIATLMTLFKVEK